MTLTLSLPPDLEDRLQHEAERQGLPADTLTLRLLDLHLPSKDVRGDLVTLLQSWMEESDAQEQKETGEYLIRVLDEDRLSDRPLLVPPRSQIVSPGRTEAGPASAVARSQGLPRLPSPDG